MNSAQTSLLAGTAVCIFGLTNLFAYVSPNSAIPYLGAVPQSAQDGVAIAQDSESLFDGESLQGWEFLSNEAEWWTVTDGFLTGGSLEKEVPHNTFLQTEESYQNFDLTFEVRIRTTGGFANSGIQVRSQRVAGSSEMTGFQVDAGDGYWGHLYDESRRGLIQRAEKEAEVNASIHPGEWNSYRILAEGPRLQSWINGIHATDYTEADGTIPLEGRIAIQTHGGGKVQVQVKDIRIKRIQDTPGAMTWAKLIATTKSHEQAISPWRSAEEEMESFTLADGFEIELVASEEHVQKLVDIAFDDSGRMWGLTAAEYPIDANEDPAAAAKYQGGGRDQVVVFDNIWSEEIQRPRIFADGFAMPMAILPEGDSILLAHGPEILRLYDDDGDGKSDRREVVLDGFGIQDSHLMPHRFVRAPGGWVYVAQGAYNSSSVRTRDGETIPYNKCKIGRFRRDGSAFEVVGVGLNNIWGFVLDRQGEMWIQEANDLGYPIVPFYHGASYPGIGNERSHPTSPWQPPISTLFMGGTGLSGLAQSQDRNGFPAPWDQRFIIANPIMSLMQSVSVEAHARPNELDVVACEDLVVSADKNFRPVAAHFGPDGCLYIVDWYNPIISHNEVSRDHPDRDKKSTRIWRIRHSSQSKLRPLDVASVPASELPALLDSDSTWISRAAWHQIAERGTPSLVAELTSMALSQSLGVEARILALWSLEDMGALDTDLVRAALSDSEHVIVREGARLCAGQQMPAEQVADALSSLVANPNAAVRRAAIETLSAQEIGDQASTTLLLRFLRPALDAPSVPMRNRNESALTGRAGEVAFERSLIRMALEKRTTALTALLDADALHGLAADAQVFAALCQGGVLGASRLAPLLGQSGRRPNAEELAVLGRHQESSDVQKVLFTWLGDEQMREEILRAFLESGMDWGKGPLAARLVGSLRALVGEGASPERVDLALAFAQKMRLSAFEPDVISLMRSGAVDRVAALRTLIEMGCQNASLFHEIATSSVPGSEVRERSVGALASVNSVAAFTQLLALWPALERGSRKAAISEVLAFREGATRVLNAMEEGQIELEALGGIAWSRLQGHLGRSESLVRLQARAAEGQIQCLSLAGGEGDFGDVDLHIEGPFTMESWLYLEPGIGSEDSLLALPGVFDFNFYDGYARVWGGSGLGDAIIATRRSVPATWFHIAVTRDDAGLLKLYLDGELNQISSKPLPDKVEGLDIGRSSRPSNTKGRIAELRLWDTARNADEIAGSFRQSFEAGELVPNLVFSSTRQPVPIRGNITVEPAFDPPPLQTAAEAQAQRKRFAKYRGLANAVGDIERGRAVFARTCMACHSLGGAGGAIGPVLDGVGAKTVEGLLRSILTPNAGVESGYRNLIVRMHTGDLLVGFLASENDDSISLRRIGREDLSLLKSEIESMRFNKLSLMPEGLMDGLSDSETTDLFEYLKAAK